VWSGEFDVADPHLSDDPLLASDGAAFDEARLLVRVFGEPVGFVTLPLTEGRPDRELLWQVIDRDLAETVDGRLRTAGAPSLAELRRGTSCAGVDRPAWTSSARDTPVSVIVGTRDRSAILERCLRSLQGVAHDDLEVLVVDNAPADDSTARLVETMARDDPRLRYLREERRGLSHARNRGAREARGEIVAFIDDDVRVDRLWVAGLLRGFARGRDVGCVTGIVATASLERAVERYFDARVSWSRCEQRLFAAARGPRDSWLHPYAPGAFGTGANVAFRAATFRALGGFDECFGPGTPVAAAEDLDVFVRVLLAGYRLSYEPAALVWHAHRVSEHDLDRQLYAYGKGLAAYLCKHAMSRRSGPEIAARSLVGTWHFVALTRRSRMAAQQTIVGHHVLGPELRGILVGPWAYARSRRIEARRTVVG
jgi:GT2 family glycosyltransferase